MNWRGIIGIYAGFAVVLGGAWLWMRMGALWTLGVIALGVVLAVASVVHIVLARRGPRPAKVRPVKIGKAAARKAASVSEDEADAIAKARLAAITGRTSGRTAVAVEPFEAAAPEPVYDARDVSDVDLSEPVAAHGPSAAQFAESEPESEPEPRFEPEAEAEPEVAERIEPDDSWQAEAAPTVVADAPSVEDERSGDDGGRDAEPVALDTLPGFPWSARFIGLWTREVRFACPDDLRSAVVHWQRWADEQESGVPIVAEAAEEFKAMLAAWREWGGEVPGLSSDDEVARQLAEEAAEDDALAAVLPGVLLQLSRQEG